MTNTDESKAGLSQEQLDAIEGFQADYNAVDQCLRKAAGGDRQLPFTYLVKEFAKNHHGWRDAELLLTIAALRNALVHNKTEPYAYVAVPTPGVTRELKAARGRLADPARADPTFRRSVVVVSTSDSLAKVLRCVAERNFSQFPVYSEAGLCGLLTENGVTRWLARHVTSELSLVELEDVPVDSVLRSEEGRPNYTVVARDTRVDDVQGLFASEDMLEAVLITHTGKNREKLLGIATRWDMRGLR